MEIYTVGGTQRSIFIVYTQKFYCASDIVCQTLLLPIMSTSQRVALISGANKGIGFQTARELARRGYLVYAGSRDETRGRAAAQQLCSESLAVEYLWLDMENPRSFHEAVELLNSRHGSLDVLVNNAAEQNESEEWNVNTSATIAPDVLRRCFDINFFSLVELTQLLLPLLLKSDAGRIVNVSSILASLQLHATPGSNTYNTKTFAYNSSKAALNSFTIHLAHALRNTPIKVNSAHPGWVQTDLGGAGATLTVEQGAETLVQLATLDPDGPTGGYFFRGTILPW